MHHSANCHLLSGFMLRAILLRLIRLSVILLFVILTNVGAPLRRGLEKLIEKVKL